MIEIKICSKCGKKLSLDMFYKSPKGKYGVRGECKLCDSERQKKYKAANKNEIAEYKRNYYDKNREQIVEFQKKYRGKNKAKASEYNTKYQQENKSELLAKKKVYREDNKEKVAESIKKWYKNNYRKLLNYNKKYYEENKDKVHGYKKKYRNNNRDKINVLSQKRRSQKRNVPNTLTTNQWDNIKKDFNNECCYCGKELPLEQEHFIPLSKGGEYTINNIIPSCRSCNSIKKDKDFFEGYPKYKYYTKARESKILKHLGYKDSNQQLIISI